MAAEVAEAPLVVAAEVLLVRETTVLQPSGGPGATTVTIDPDAVPLANLPNEDGAADLLVIDDEDVPLAALPKTGQEEQADSVLFLSSMMLAAFVAVSKKREDDK